MKQKLCAAALAVLYVSVVLGILVAKVFGYQVVFPYPWVTACVLTVCAVVPTVLWCLAGKSSHVACEVVAMILPLVSEVVLAVLLAKRHIALLLVGIAFFVCAVAALLRVVHHTWTKVVSVALCLPLLLPIVVFGGLTLLSIYLPFGEQTVLQTAVSPDGTYVAELIDDDQGALGGATVITVRRTKKEVNLLVFALEHEAETVYYGDWGEGFGKALEWKDGQTLTFDGMPLEVDP